MTELTIKLIIILLPGAISTIIFGKLILHKQWDNFKFVLNSILFGAFSYLVLQIGILILNFIFCSNIPELSLWDNLTKPDKIAYGEILLSILASIIIACVASWFENEKVIANTAKKLKISNKYGEENMYSRFLGDKDVGYVYVRHIKNDLTYYGWVKGYSETDNFSEIRLCDVSVYNYGNSKHLYNIPEVYLSFNKHEITIELADKEDINIEKEKDGKEESKCEQSGEK